MCIVYGLPSCGKDHYDENPFEACPLWSMYYKVSGDSSVRTFPNMCLVGECIRFICSSYTTKVCICSETFYTTAEHVRGRLHWSICGIVALMCECVRVSSWTMAALKQKGWRVKRQSGTPHEGPGGSRPGVAPPAPPQHTVVCSQTFLLICPADMATG